MRRIRLLLVAAIVGSFFMFGASPANACPPDGYCPPCGNEKIDAVWQKVTGRPLFNCPM